MKKAITSILLLIILFSLFSLLEKVSSGLDTKNVDVTDVIVSSTDPSYVRLIAGYYKKGVTRERLGAYENALFSYTSCCTKAMELLSDKRMGREGVEKVLPYAIAAAYRKGILTHRTIEGSVMKLYKQLEMYQDANITIDEVLTVISNISTERSMNISPVQYYPLYYARAYNRFGWAYALLNGSAWKRYIIYTPADTITMVDKSVEDIRLALTAFNIDYSRGAVSEWFITNNVYGALKDKLTDRSIEHVTFALCFNAYDLKVINKIVEMHVLKKMRKALELNGDGRTIQTLNRGRKIFTYEDFMKPGTKDIISVMSQFLEIMK